MTGIELGIKSIERLRNLIEAYGHDEIFYYDEKDKSYWPKNEKMDKLACQFDELGFEIVKAEDEGKTISIEAIIADIKNKPDKMITEEEKDIIVANIHNGKYDVISEESKPEIPVSENEIMIAQVSNTVHPAYIISAGKVEVKFPESNANVEQKVKDFFGSECMLKSLAAKLADGEYQFKVLSGDAKVPLKLLCCLPDKEILLSYKDNSCEVTVVEI